ncbi:AraC family transcriptional regulator [Gordonia sp. NPDC003424]
MDVDTDQRATAVDIDLQTVESHRRAAVWTDVLSTHYYALQADIPDGFGRARLETYELGDIRVGSLRADPMHIHREATHTGFDGDEYMTFMLLADASANPIVLSQHGRDAHTDTNSIAFIGTATPYSYDQPEHTDLQTLRIPAALVRERVSSADSMSAVRFDDSTSPITRLVLAFARTLSTTGDRFAPAVAQSVQDQLLDLLALMMTNADLTSTDSSVRSAHRQRAIMVVEERFRDPEFNAHQVAQAVSVSERYLQKVFADHGETLSGIIRSRRIAEARKQLTRRSSTGRSVASIAGSCGFADSAYFSRVFRQETGVTPREYGTP